MAVYIATLSLQDNSKISRNSLALPNANSQVLSQAWSWSLSNISTFWYLDLVFLKEKIKQSFDSILKRDCNPFWKYSSYSVCPSIL